MRIVQVLQDESHWGEIGPEALSTGLGGRETAMVQLAMKWAEHGHEVVTFCPRQSTVEYEVGSGTSRFAPYQLFEHAVPAFGADALVMWECPWAADVPGVNEMVGFTCVEMQVAHLAVQGEEFDRLNENIDKWCVLSEWAGKFLGMQERGVRDKLVVLPNGVDLSRWADTEIVAGHPVFYYSSSPDRGLVHLLKAWPIILDKIPRAKLHIAYGAEKWIEGAMWSHNAVSEDALSVAELLDQPGVVYQGKIGQDKLAEIQLKADMLLYPCDPVQPTETGCITAVEAGASQTAMVLSEADCLKSEFGDCSVQAKLPMDYVDFAELAVQTYNDQALREELVAKGSIMAEERDWDKIATRWERMFREEQR